jgi:hypothetical protein
MSFQGKRELLAQVAPRYREANRLPSALFHNQRWVTLFVRQYILQSKILSEAMRWPGHLG